jgi:NADPH-dependent glutamate synthase beta subunit-like oxidoreductase
MPIDPLRDFQIPFISMSDQGTLGQKTGMWGRMRPFLLEKKAPCRNDCPAGVPIPQVLGRLQEGRLEEALSCIREENPLPRIAGRVCFHPCESNCSRNRFDQPVSIRSLERAISETPVIKPFACEPNGRRIAVIGSGPAGLSCSYSLALLGYRVTLFEAEKKLGGMLRYGIPAYRLPKGVLDREIEDLLSLGIEPRVGEKIDQALFMKRVLGNYDSIFIATGAWRSSRMNFAGETSPSVMAALQFLQEVNQGRKPRLGQNVLIIGGGNTALDAARTSLRMGSRPRVIYRRSRQEMPAFSEEVEEAEEEGIEILYLNSPVRILREDGHLKGLECVRNRLVEPGKDGRPLPEPVPESSFVLEADTILTAVGEAPDLSFLPPGARITEGLIEIEGRQSGEIFLGGDLLVQPRTVVHAIQSGKEAAIRIDQYIKNGKRGESSGWRSLSAYRRGEPDDQEAVVRFEDLNLSYFEHRGRVVSKKRSPKTRAKRFGEVTRTLLPEAAIEEARRCFQCGLCNGCKNCYVFCPEFIVSVGEKMAINYDYCKGCCICVEECPRGAMTAEVKG